MHYYAIASDPIMLHSFSLKVWQGAAQWKTLGAATLRLRLQVLMR